MKHLKYVSKETPVRAFAIDLGKDEHPDIIDSIQGFLADGEWVMKRMTRNFDLERDVENEVI